VLLVHPSSSASSGTPKATAPTAGSPKVSAGAKSSGGKHATIETAKGPIDIEFIEDAAPEAVEN